ncbi:MAG: IS66 family insertion sequence element accessory protein TnpB [Anaerolineae bacterium]|jgi:transposase
MLTLPSAVRIFVRAEPTDMRYGFPKLSMLAEHLMGQDPFSGHLFVFFNRRGDKCKILFWDRTGFCLWYKRLEEGTFETLPAKPDQATIEVDIAKLTWILEGIDLFRTRRRKRYQRPPMRQAE